MVKITTFEPLPGEALLHRCPCQLILKLDFAGLVDRLSCSFDEVQRTLASANSTGENECSSARASLCKAAGSRRSRLADTLWLNQEVADSQPKASQTIRIDADVAARLQTFASQHGESVNNAIVRLLRLGEEEIKSDDGKA